MSYVRNLSLLSSMLVFSLGCGEDGAEAPAGGLPANASEVVENYAAIVYASYQDSLTTAENLDASIRALVDTPSADALTAAQDEWRQSRVPYLQTEVYRFYVGPIDNAEDGPEGFINAWPLDEVYIDYTVANPNGGIVNDPSQTIDRDALLELNEVGGETNIATGYHAIEFLLWGQDMSETGPGARPYTDYVTGEGGTAANQDRRGDYLTTASALLVEHLEGLAAAWGPGDPSNFRAQFEALPPDEALGKILSGMVILSGFETGGERIQAALLARDQEEEHSCFSDNTHVDMIEDVRGVQNVWLGSYRRLDGTVVSGPSLEALVAASNPELAEQITEKIEESLSLALALDPPFDKEISADNPAGNERVEALSVALFEQKDLIDLVFDRYGLTRIPDPI